MLRNYMIIVSNVSEISINKVKIKEIETWEKL